MYSSYVYLCIPMGSIGIPGNLGAVNHHLGTGRYSYVFLCVPMVPLGIPGNLGTGSLSTWAPEAISMYSDVLFLGIPMLSLCISMGSIGITDNLGAGNHQLGTGNYSFLLLCVPLFSHVFFLCVPMHSHVFLRGLEQYLVPWGLPATTWTLGAIPMYSCVFLCIPMHSLCVFLRIPMYS